MGHKRCHLPSCCRKVNGSQRGERGRERCPHKRAGGRQTHDTVSDVSCHSEPQSKCRRQSRGKNDSNCARARQKVRRHLRHNCHANADWLSQGATHATQNCMGASGMDSRRARGGETEAMDSRGQDNARYAKVTSDGKKGDKEGARGQAEARGGEGGKRGREGARGGREGGERGARGGERGREGARGGRERGERGGRQTDDTVVTSVVVVNHSIESGGSDINCAQARHQKGRCHVRRTRNRTLDVTECHACHTKVHGSQRDGLAGGEKGRDRGHG